MTAQRWIFSLFVPDQWAFTKQLTANLGVRAYRVGNTDRRTHFQPSASLVYVSGAGFERHRMHNPSGGRPARLEATQVGAKVAPYRE